MSGSPMMIVMGSEQKKATQFKTQAPLALI
jgi:hypothetical protein